MPRNPDDENRQALSRMKFAATGLLFLMAVLLLAGRVYLPKYPELAWLIAFSEAALVGALADWFAVTALFRRPLGLPIPHTAIIPANKDRIGRTLGDFVETNFLTSEIIGHKVKQLRLANHAAQWLQREENAKRVSSSLCEMVPHIISGLNDDDVKRFLSQNLEGAVRHIKLSPLVGHVLAVLLRRGKHDRFLDELLGLFKRLMEKHYVFIRDTIRGGLPWYVPNVVHNKVYQDFILALKAKLSEVIADPHHELRERFARTISELIARLISAPEFLERGERIKLELLESATVREYLDQVIGEMLRRIEEELLNTPTERERIVSNALVSFGQTLSNDVAIQSKLERWIELGIRKFLDRYHGQISSLVSEIVKQWDTATIVNKLELQVGRDLQFIRLNGTLVGGLVGILIYSLGLILQR